MVNAVPLEVTVGKETFVEPFDGIEAMRQIPHVPFRFKGLMVDSIERENLLNMVLYDGKGNKIRGAVERDSLSQIKETDVLEGVAVYHDGNTEYLSIQGLNLDG